MEIQYRAAFEALDSIYKRIIEVDLTQDSYKVLTFGENTKYFGSFGDMGKFSVTVSSVVLSDIVHVDDKEMVRYYLSLEHLRSVFLSGKRMFYFRYRQVVDNEVRWHVAEMVKAASYQDEHQIVYLFIKDIHESYAEELKAYAEMERICRHDVLTGLNNFYSYKIACIDYAKYHKQHELGAFFCDLNGLKIINDTQGHGAGNIFIKNFARTAMEIFPEDHIYRISGDEFVVLLFDVPKELCLSLANDLHNAVIVDGEAIASIGFSWHACPENIEDVVKKAEIEMYAEKEQYYKRHPELKREIFEEEYSKEMKAIISSFISLYPTVGIINLEDDSFRMLKADESSKLAAEGKSYTEYINILMTQIVTPETYDEANKLAGIPKLRAALKYKEQATVTFTSRRGGTRFLTCQRLEMKNGEASKVIFYIRYKD